MTAAAPAKLPDRRKSVSKKDLEHETGLYRHVKRPEWGVAILAWEKGKRRGYQFDDGKLRKIRKGYYSFMEPVTEIHGSEQSVVADLREAIAANKGARKKTLEPSATFEQQLEIFRTMYPGGFQDGDWIEDHRKGAGGKELKRHRDPAMKKTQELLSKERCAELISEGRHLELTADTLGILAKTSLVPVKTVRALKGLDDEEKVEFAESVRTLLHGKEKFGRRFTLHLRFLRRVLGVRPSWRLATALPALMFPDEHVCVRRTAFLRQAGTIAPAAVYTRKPRRRSYANFRAVAFAVKERLEAAGHTPRDMLDVREFIWATLRNAALKHLPGN